MNSDPEVPVSVPGTAKVVLVLPEDTLYRLIFRLKMDKKKELTFRKNIRTYMTDGEVCAQEEKRSIEREQEYDEFLTFIKVT